MKTMNVSRDFSRFPVGRFYRDGPYSGEKFREEHLLPAIGSASRIVIELDGTEGYGSSFLEEAFGGLVREGYISMDDFKAKFQLVSEDRLLRAEIEEYIESAAASA